MYLADGCYHNDTYEHYSQVMPCSLGNNSSMKIVPATVVNIAYPVVATKPAYPTVAKIALSIIVL